MKVLVDTSVWSLALRRKPGALAGSQKRVLDILNGLIAHHRAALIGPIRQELLGGVRDKTQFRNLRDHLRHFNDEPILREDYETAASFRNTCLSGGVAGSPIDFLICAVASRLRFPIFTLDRDFERFSKHVNIDLFKVSWRGR